MLDHAIMKKVAAVAGELPSLVKDTDNPEAGIKYPSIDQYYAKIASKARDLGLFWTISEDSCDIEIVPDDGAIARYRYLFSLYDLEEERRISEIPISILHPLQGAQTTGSAMSYAEKIFMRTLFKVVTGEPDADAFAKPKRAKGKQPDPFEQVPAPAPQAEPGKPPRRQKPAVADSYPTTPELQIPDDAPLPPATGDQKLEAKTNVLIGLLGPVTSKAELHKWRQDADNKRWIEEIKEESSYQYGRLQDAFQQKKAEIDGKPAAV